jgi:hypothetical protein
MHAFRAIRVAHRADAIEYEPMFIDGEPVGKAHQLRNGIP